MRRDAKEEKKKKKKAEDLAKTQKTTPAVEEGTSGGVTEKNMIPSDEEQDEDYKALLETHKGTEDQEDSD